MHALTSPRSRKSKCRLLYLGTDMELIAALRQMLTEPYYRLVTCSDRESCILFLKSEIPYDSLLIDFEWQGTEGLKLARLAHSLSHRKRMPIILVAATELSSGLKTLARKAGVSKWVTKTPDVGAVNEVIRQLVGRG
jgi:response regulator RpfG family c-di-GMP phosphodiesterase